MSLFYDSCKNCIDIKAQREQINFLEEKITKMKKHYSEDIATLNKQINLERAEYRKNGFIIEDVKTDRSIENAYSFDTFTTYDSANMKTKASKRSTYYQYYFKE